MRALITGITGQDGSYLAEQLLEEGTEVFGLVRRSSSPHFERIEHLLTGDPGSRITLLEGDLLDQGSLIRAVQESRPDEVYNLAAQSFVGRSWKEPVHTAEVTGLGALRVFEAARIAAPEARIYQASTSEMFGLIGGKGTEEGPFHPRSPYGTAKLFAHTTAVNYRESYGMRVSCGILFNHESPRRSPQFVTRKVCMAAARAARGDKTRLGLGALDSRRDWGWAPDYVAAMVQMSRRAEPGDFIVATGKSHSVADLCEVAYRTVGLNWRDFVTTDPAFVRPAEIPDLVGDPARAGRELGWTATVSFEDMIERMVAHELGNDVHRLGRRAG